MERRFKARARLGHTIRMLDFDNIWGPQGIHQGMPYKGSYEVIFEAVVGAMTGA